MKSQNAHSSNKNDLQGAIQVEPLWTVEDVANYLRLQEETVRMMARANKLPALKIGKVWRFRASDIKDMLITK